MTRREGDAPRAGVSAGDAPRESTGARGDGHGASNVGRPVG